MGDEELERRLAARDLTTPGISLDEAVRRAAGRTPSRRPSWTRRLVLAAIVTWVAVVAVQAAVERNMDALVPASPVLVVGEAGPTLLAQQRRLLAELMWDATGPPDTAQSSRDRTGPAMSGPTDHQRSGSLSLRRWSHV